MSNTIIGAYKAVQKAVSSSNTPSTGTGFIDVLKNQASEVTQNLKQVDQALVEHMKGNLSSEEITPMATMAVLEAKGFAEVIRSTADATTKVLNITV